MALKLAHAIGGEAGSELLDYVAKNCKYSGVKNTSHNLNYTIRSKHRLKKVYGTTVKIGTRSIPIEKATNSDLEHLIDDAIKSGDKALVKRLDAFLYGQKLETSE